MGSRDEEGRWNGEVDGCTSDVDARNGNKRLKEGIG